MNILEMSKQEIVESLIPKEEPIKNTHVIRMSYTTEMKDGLRRCGKCGEFNPLEDYKTKEPGYDWKCSECRKYDEVYND